MRENNDDDTGVQLLMRTFDESLADAKGNRAKGKSKEARDINLALDNIKAQIIKHYQRISDREAYVTAEMVRNAYQGIGTEYEIYLSTDAGLHNGSVWSHCMWLKTGIDFLILLGDNSYLYYN